MSLTIELNQLVGTVVGGVVSDQSATIAHDLDEILVVDVTGVKRRVGFCPHADGSAVRFVRFPNDEAQRAEIVAEVARIRKERGLDTDTRSSLPPDPAAIKAALKREKRA